MSYQLTPNDVIDSITPNDSTIEVVGFVDCVERPIIVGKVKKFKLMKFAINNDAGRRIQCTAWQGQADRVAAVVQLNKVIYLDGVQSKLIEYQNFNMGNVTFELVINSNAKITNMGDWENSSAEEVPVVALADVADTRGKIKVSGFMKTLVSLAEHQQGASSQGIGSITDKNLKLEIHTASIENLLHLEKGQPVEITGTICYGRIIYLQVADGDSIVALDGEKICPMDMINVTKMPAKKAKLDE